MALTIDTNSLENAASHSCHFIPCKIAFDGVAKVSDFFETTVTTARNDEKELSASFRGRPLKGTQIELPSGYTGLILKEPHKRSTEDEDRTLIASHKFDKFTYWNLDKEPTSDDLLQRALQWIDIAEALHRPVSTEAEDSQSQRSIKGQ